MMPADLLVQLVTCLQKDVSGVHGRRALLDYIRQSSRAGQGLLFIVDKERQALRLLERSGRGPRHAAHPEFDPQSISLHGLFAQALQTQGLLHISDARDPRSLKEERYWTWPGGHVVLSAVGRQAGERNRPQGVLVLCFDSDHGEWHNSSAQTVPAEGPLLISISLLAAYLVESDSDATHAVVPLSGHTGKNNGAGTRDRLQRERQQETSCNADKPDTRQQRFDEIIRILATLYEQRVAEQEAIVEQERKRIAREIHDGAAQQIAYAMYKLEFIQRIFEKQPQMALHDIARVYDILEESLQDLRHGIASLIPPQLEQHGFDAALRELFKSYEPELAIRYDADYGDMLPSSLEVPIFRFIQEALSNVHKHAQAGHVTIRIRTLSGLLLVQVDDDGMGFLPEQVTGSAGSHFGLRTMRERIEQAGGMLEIRSKPAEGTFLKARFPLTTPAAMLTGREREVLRLLVEGSTNRAIAKRLSVSIETVKSHVHHIIQKMHVRDRTQAAVIATRQRWLEL